jgi:ABC-type transport system substrate-binding protein
LKVHIRPGAEWADGVPFTAKDVAFSDDQTAYVYSSPFRPDAAAGTRAQV